MRQNHTEVHLSRLEGELRAGAGAAASEAEVRDVVRQALRDLAGSVPRDSLPEMASRLAATRLRDQRLDRSSPKVPVAV